jgi:tryptophanyl-tRNA synthetase
MGSEDHGVVLTGIKPTGDVHLGNYLGCIRPALELAAKRKAFFFIADYHGLTSVSEPDRLRRQVVHTAAAWIAMGLDSQRTVFYRQSDVPEIFELMWVLACITAKGMLNRAHAYKAATAANLGRGRQSDAGINAGLYNYPLLMAADILAFRTAVVPVGGDQRQHVEIARDIAAAFNRRFGAVFTLPRALIRNTGVIPGIDGRKMSKSYGNDIALLASAEALRERTMHIVTDSQPPEAPKDPEHCNLFAIYRHIADGKAVERLRGRYLAGGVAYREVKEMLATELIDRFEAPRRRYADLVDNEEKLFMILSEGARAARRTAREVLAAVRRAVGVEVDAGNRKVVSWQQAARKRRPLEKLTPGDDDG